MTVRVPPGPATASWDDRGVNPMFTVTLAVVVLTVPRRARPPADPDASVPPVGVERIHFRMRAH
jgi:hypothetical protein